MVSPPPGGGTGGFPHVCELFLDLVDDSVCHGGEQGLYLGRLQDEPVRLAARRLGEPCPGSFIEYVPHCGRDVDGYLVDEARGSIRIMFYLGCGLGCLPFIGQFEQVGAVFPLQPTYGLSAEAVGQNAASERVIDVLRAEPAAGRDADLAHSGQFGERNPLVVAARRLVGGDVHCAAAGVHHHEPRPVDVDVQLLFRPEPSANSTMRTWQ